MKNYTNRICPQCDLVTLSQDYWFEYKMCGWCAVAQGYLTLSMWAKRMDRKVKEKKRLRAKMAEAESVVG